MQGARVGRPEGEEIDNDQPAEAPIAREPDTAANRGVVGGGVGRRWVQADEDHCRPIAVPNARERITIAAAGGEFGGGKERRTRKGESRSFASLRMTRWSAHFFRV